MNSNLISNRKKDIFGNLKSKYILQIIFDNMQTKKSLEIIKYNKIIQQRLNINITNYKEYCEKFTTIEIEIIPMKNIDTKILHLIL